MSTQDNLYQEILEAVVAHAKKFNMVLPSWFQNEESDIVHPALCRSLPAIDGEWWSLIKPVTLVLTVSPEVRIEDEYYVLLVTEDTQTVTRISGKNGNKSAVMNPEKWIKLAVENIHQRDRYTIQITATIAPSQGGNTLFREISSISCQLIKN